MNTTTKLLIVLFVGLFFGAISCMVKIEEDFIWSIRTIVIPVLITLFSLFTSLSINLVKTLDTFEGPLRDDAMNVILSMRSGLLLEMFFLLITFFLMIIFPLFSDLIVFSTVLRGFIDSLIVTSVMYYAISNIETLFAFLDLNKRNIT